MLDFFGIILVNESLITQKNIKHEKTFISFNTTHLNVLFH